MYSSNWRTLVQTMGLGMATLGVATPASAHSSGHHRAYYQPATGSVLVHNDAGASVTVTVGGESRVVREQGYTAITVPAGELSFRATYHQFGVTRTVESETIYVRPGRTTRVTVDPEDDARVMVENRTELPGELYVNGRYFAKVAAFGSKVVTLPRGKVELTLRAGSRTLVSRLLCMEPFAEPHLVAEPPRFASVMVDNPLPVAVRLVTDGGEVRTVEARGRTRYDGVAVGNFALTATRLSGERIDREVVRVDAFEGGRWCVDAPVTGVLAIDSQYSRGSQVFVNDRLVATLAPEADARAVLGLGWVEVEVRDDRGRCISEDWVEIEPYDVARLTYGHDARGEDRYGDDRGDRHHEAATSERDEREDREQHREGRRSDHDGVATR